MFSSSVYGGGKYTVFLLLDQVSKQNKNSIISPSKKTYCQGVIIQGFFMLDIKKA